MSASTNIEWCDSTFNPWIGCTKVSPACDHCYAEALMDHRMHKAEWGAGKLRVATSADNWKAPLRWNKRTFFACTACGWRGDDIGESWVESGTCSRCERKSLTTARRRVFCASLGDVFDNEVPIDWLVELLELIRLTPNLDWLLLTKRIGNCAGRLTLAAFCIRKYLGRSDERNATLEWIEDWLGSRAPSNVWMGATICNQAEADRDALKLLSIPAAVRFLSIEPLLGPIDLDRGGWSLLAPPHPSKLHRQRISWVIVGGESGVNARPMHPDWARSIRRQCVEAGVSFFFKQWGEWMPGFWFDGPDADVEPSDYFDLDHQKHLFLARDCRTWDTNGGRYMYPPMPLGRWCCMVRVGKTQSGRQLDGREWDQFPEVRA